MSFEYHLKRKGLCKSSISSHQYTIELFKKWQQKQGIATEHIDYNEIINYVKHCRIKGNKDNTIEQKLMVIRYYLDYHGIKPNPCTQWHINRKRKPLPSPLFSEKEIQHIYESYPEDSVIKIRNKVIIGLLCYQGLNGGDIRRLELKSIHREAEVILIKPASPLGGKKKSSKGRSLRIAEIQKRILYKYLDETRVNLLRGREDKGKLIINHTGLDRINGILLLLARELRERHEHFNRFNQIRASVISNWLKHYNLREVQYMAGHRYISSTERYLESRVEELQQLLDELHPMK